MAVSILCGYGFGLLLERYRGGRAAKYICGISVGISLCFLLYFKYTDFFLQNFNAVTGADFPLLHIALPIGISFYTFQIISYTVDVYRGEPAQTNLVHFAAYIAMFPQLIAGPIVRYSDIAAQLEDRTHSTALAAEGIRRFIIGLGKKILLANQLGELCGAFRASEEKSVLFYWLYALAFALHIYFDFSGYSDMAIGLGKLFGFDFLENFNYPFISKSITEFWRRWHMSLGTWFRDYVYIPLGGSRVSIPRHLFNIFLVWMLTGFWHGAAWNFVIWGLYFALLLILEKVWLLEILKKSHVLNRIYVLIAAVISFVIFDATDMSQAFSYLKAMFGAGGYPLISAACSYYFRSYFVVLMIALLGATPIPKSFCRRLQQRKMGTAVMLFAEPLALSALLLICTAFLVDGSFNPFLYFRF